MNWQHLILGGALLILGGGLTIYEAKIFANGRQGRLGFDNQLLILGITCIIAGIVFIVKYV